MRKDGDEYGKSVQCDNTGDGGKGGYALDNNFVTSLISRTWTLTMALSPFWHPLFFASCLFTCQTLPEIETVNDCNDQELGNKELRMCFISVVSRFDQLPWVLGHVPECF